MAKPLDPSIDDLLRALASANGAARLAAAEALAERDELPPSAVPALLEALFRGKIGDDDDEARESILCALRTLGPAAREGAPRIRALLASRSQAIEVLASSLLLAIDLDGTVDALVAPLGSGGDARSKAAQSLWTMVQYVSGGLALSRKPRSGRGEPALFAALRARALGALCEAARDEDWYIRSCALGALGHLGPSGDEVLAVLLAGAEDPEESARRSAISGLGYWGAHAAPAVPALCNALHGPLDREACRALGAIGAAAREAVPLLERRVARGDPAGSSAAKVALEKIRRAERKTKEPAKKATDARATKGARAAPRKAARAPR